MLQKNRLIETGLSSTHNICFGWEIRKIIFLYPLLSGGLLGSTHLFFTHNKIRFSSDKAHLISLTGLMSGLTMGLLSLDMMSLKVMKDGGTDSEKKHARRIIPIVKRHHLLLVTLLLGNAAAVEAMPIFLDRISDPITAILVSVTAVLIFGEYDFTCLSKYDNFLYTTMQSLFLIRLILTWILI